MCGIIGITSVEKDVPLKIYEGLTYLQHRGQDSCGICNEEYAIKKNGLVKNSFEINELNKLMSNNCIGHVRYSTTGSFDDSLIQPLVKDSNDLRISLCHNGNITNTEYIKSIIKVENLKSDSEYLLELFFFKLNEYNNEINCKNIFKICEYIIDNINGSFSVIILMKNY